MKKFFIFLVSIAFLHALIFAGASTTNACGVPGIYPPTALPGVGGVITIELVCDNGFLLTIINPIDSSCDGDYMLQPFLPTVPFLDYNYTEGSWTLSNYIYGGVCLFPPFVPITALGTLFLSGTGLTLNDNNRPTLLAEQELIGPLVSSGYSPTQTLFSSFSLY